MPSRRIDTGKLVIASHNEGKVREFRELFAPYNLDIFSAADFDLPEPIETGSTFEENANLKAESASKLANIPALADDSGFCVNALNGDPGIYSARWAGPKKDFSIAMQKIEENLKSINATSMEDRGAKFVAVLCIAWPDGFQHTFRGEVAGTVVWPPRGDKGFGYDPIFLPEGHSMTFGEMDSKRKHSWSPKNPESALSHRSRAFGKFANTCLNQPQSN